MIVAAIMLIITYKLKQSMVIGYILAGIVIGPYTPPFSLIHNIDTVNVFAGARHHNATLCNWD